MIFILLVYSCGFTQVGQRLLAELLKSVAILLLALPSAGAAALGCFAATGGFRIGFAAQL
jgi:hypothetical protein